MNNMNRTIKITAIKITAFAAVVGAAVYAAANSRNVGRLRRQLSRDTTPLSPLTLGGLTSECLLWVMNAATDQARPWTNVSLTSNSDQTVAVRRTAASCQGTSSPFRANGWSSNL
jgi:hypothetical protein